MASSDFDVVVLGDCNPDLVLSGERIEPAFGQVERLVDGAELTIGGSGGIMAAGAARLGLRTAFVGVVGDDLFGSFMRDALAQRGVDTGAIVVEASARTGLTVILSRAGDRAILTFPGTIAALSADGVDPGAWSRAPDTSTSPPTSCRPRWSRAWPSCSGEPAHAGASTSIDPNWDPTERWDGGLREVLAVTDLFLPNAEEATRIAGREDPGTRPGRWPGSVRWSRSSSAPRGRSPPPPTGSSSRRTPRRAPSRSTPSAPGDSFDAGVLAGLLRGWSLERALTLGCACGALSTRAVGGTAAQPTLAEALAA